MIFGAVAHGAEFQADHYIAGIVATMTAAASLLGAIAALGFKKKETHSAAMSDCDRKLEAFMKGAEFGARQTS